MKLFLVIFLVSVGNANKLHNNYLPPLSESTTDGGNILAPANRNYFPQPEPAFTRTGFPTSYAAPASGPVPSSFYYSPAVRTYPVLDQYQPTDKKHLSILKYINNNNGEGVYRFEYQTENRIAQEEEGYLKNVGTDHESIVVLGSYSYTSPEGQFINVEYVADEDGFRAIGDHIPTTPATPVPIGKILKIHTDGSHTKLHKYTELSSRNYLLPSRNMHHNY